MTFLLLYLSYLGTKSNQTIEDYSKIDFEIRQAARSVSQIRSHVAKSGWSCEISYSKKNPQYTEDCFIALDASYAQISSGVLKEHAPYIEKELNSIYDLTEKILKNDPDKVKLKQDAYKHSIQLFREIGIIESKYWQQTSQNYTDLSAVIKQRSLISIFVIVSIFFILLSWIFLLLKQDDDDLKLVQARESLEKQRVLLIQSGKMSALGEMAAGIAHEINNPLTIIEGKSSQIKKTILAQPTVDAKALESIEKILKMTDRISAIIRGLRNFARDGEKDPLENRDIRLIIDETLELCETRLKNHNVRIDYERSEASDLIISCRPTQISQVILNLIHNGNDAMEGIEEKWIRIEVKRVDQIIRTSITDAGLGISKEVEEKIFNPFFTTKEAGKGTGLGLSISKGIIEEHGGKIFVDHQSQNTSFLIDLPLAQ